MVTLGARLKRARVAVRPKLTQEAVARRLRVSPQAVSQWERDEDTPTADKFPQLADILGVDLEYLHGKKVGDDAKPPHSNGVSRKVGSPTYSPHAAPPSSIPVEQIRGDVDLPVYSIVQGGQGVLVLENDPFGYISRPRRLQDKPRAYGVLVKGNSMAREYCENDIAFVDPSLHPKKGDPCVFQGIREDGTVEAMIKYLERSPDASEAVYYVSQTNPPKKFTLKKAEWQRCHVAVGKESGR